MDLTLLAILAVIFLAAYAATATFIARGPERRLLNKIATIVAAVAVASLLAPAYLKSSFWWSKEIAVMSREVAAYAIAACVLVVPAVVATTKLARHLASAASPPVTSWVLTWVAGVTILLLSSLLSFAVAIFISGDSI